MHKYDNEQLQQELKKMKQVNKDLLVQVGQSTTHTEQDDCMTVTENCDKIHSLYQDLYLTDLKSEIQETDSML